MEKRPTTLADWRRHQYDTEKKYAEKILATKKGSPERARLLTEAYGEVIGNIIEQYDPSGGETQDPWTIVGLVRGIVGVSSPHRGEARWGAARRASPPLAPPRRGGEVTVAKKRVLDLGCGGGDLVVALTRAGYDAYGIDVSGDSITRAKEKLTLLGAADHITQGEFLDYETPVRFDCIVMDNVIEHLVPDTVHDVLVQCAMLLAPGGSLVVITPHRFSGPHDISRYFLPLGARAEGLHLHEFTYAELVADFRTAGFADVLGFLVHPRALAKIGMTARPSHFATKKALVLERLFASPPLRTLLRANRTLTRILVALSFPMVVVGVKD